MANKPYANFLAELEKLQAAGYLVRIGQPDVGTYYGEWPVRITQTPSVATSTMPAQERKPTERQQRQALARNTLGPKRSRWQ